MRVISQDGTLDAPYERLIITLSGNVSKTKYCIDGLLSDQKNSLFVKLAFYSAKEKARKAMEELQYAYACHNTVLLDKENANDIPNDTMTKAVIGGVFQFPAEEELE